MATRKKASALDEWMNAKKNPQRLLGDVSRYILEREPDTSRRQDVLHPSELIKNDFCPRGAYFRLLGHTPPPERHSMRLTSIFDEGHAAHSKWQTYFKDMGVLYGKWHIIDSYNPPRSQTCWDLSQNLPEHALSIYEEVPVFDTALRIEGKADGWIKGIGDDTLIEVKTIGPGTYRFEAPELLRGGRDLFSAWKDTRRPFPSHLRQAQLYLELLHRMEASGAVESAPNEAVFIYELKADQSVKEFTVRYDPEISAPALEEARKIVDAVNSETVPDCIKDEGPCKQCEPYEGLTA